MCMDTQEMNCLLRQLMWEQIERGRELARQAERYRATARRQPLSEEALEHGLEAPARA